VWEDFFHSVMDLFFNWLFFNWGCSCAHMCLGDFLVTIESATTRCHRTLDSEQQTARVYINLSATDLEHEPMKARVAGQLASLRLKSVSLDCVDNLRRFSVIEIPLKDTPRHLAANGQVRNIAVSMAPRYSAGSMQCRILIYGLCCKRIARSQLVYRSVTNCISCSI
jgi:hypothetical protein